MLSGEIKLTDTAIPVTARFNPVGGVNPVPTFTGVNLAATVQAGTAATADIVWMQDDSTGAFRRYFFSDGTGPGLTTGWRSANPASGAENLDAGGTWLSSGLIIRRRGSLPHTVVMKAPAYP